MKQDEWLKQFDEPSKKRWSIYDDNGDVKTIIETVVVWTFITIIIAACWAVCIIKNLI